MRDLGGTLRKWRRHRGLDKITPLLGANELAMDDVVAAAHDEHGRPIAGRQQDNAENTDL